MARDTVQERRATVSAFVQSPGALWVCIAGLAAWNCSLSARVDRAQDAADEAYDKARITNNELQRLK